MSGLPFIQFAPGYANAQDQQENCQAANGQSHGGFQAARIYRGDPTGGGCSGGRHDSIGGCTFNHNAALFLTSGHGELWRTWPVDMRQVRPLGWRTTMHQRSDGDPSATSIHQ